MMRRVLGSLGLSMVLAVTVQSVAQAAPTSAANTLTPISHTLKVQPPDAPASVCDYNQINCGFVVVQVTFAGLDSNASRPTEPGYGPPEGNLSGTVDVTRVYGCQNANGKRLRTYDRTVVETVTLNTRRGSGFRFPRTGDTVTATTYAFLGDRQPGNCPAKTTAMMYKLVARHVQLELDSYVPGITGSTTPVKSRHAWSGAVPTPVSAATIAVG